MSVRAPAPTPDDLLDNLEAIVALLDAQRVAITTNKQSLSVVSKDILEAMQDVIAQTKAASSKVPRIVSAQRPPRTKARERTVRPTAKAEAMRRNQ